MQSDTRPHATARRPTAIEEGRGGDRTESPRVLQRKLSLRKPRDAVRQHALSHRSGQLQLQFEDFLIWSRNCTSCGDIPGISSDGAGNADGDNGRHVESLVSPESGAAAPLPGGAFWERARATGLVLARCDPATSASSGAQPRGCFRI